MFFVLTQCAIRKYSFDLTATHKHTLKSLSVMIKKKREVGGGNEGGGGADGRRREEISQVVHSRIL